LDLEGHPTTPGEDDSVFACPDCGGVLHELHDGDLLRYRCRVGHAYGTDSLQAAQAGAIEAALWSALRALEEQASLGKRLAERARARDHKRSADHFAERAQAAEKQAVLIRKVLADGLRSEGRRVADGAGAPG